MSFSDMFSKGANILGGVSNGLAKAGGAQPGFVGSDGGSGGPPGPGSPQAGLMGLINKFRANRTNAGVIGQSNPLMAQGGGIGQPGAQAGTLFGSMGPARSSVPQY